MPQSQPRAILFADIAGSSHLYNALGNVEAKKQIDEAVNSMIQMSENHQGILIKTIGDEIMSRFEQTEDALKTARDIQRYYAARSLSIRIGVSFGETLLDGGDVFGYTVNSAAYVVSIAKGEQILLSESAYKDLAPSFSKHCHEFDKIRIKGEDHISLIYRMNWELDISDQNATMLLSSVEVNKKIHLEELTLYFQKQSILISTNNIPFHIGRSREDVELCILSNQVSRKHCHITYRHGKFVLVDHSSNGTYVTPLDNKEIYLRREEFPLQGEGVISLGHPSALAVDDKINFYI